MLKQQSNKNYQFLLKSRSLSLREEKKTKDKQIKQIQENLLKDMTNTAKDWDDDNYKEWILSQKSANQLKNDKNQINQNINEQQQKLNKELQKISKDLQLLNEQDREVYYIDHQRFHLKNKNQQKCKDHEHSHSHSQEHGPNKNQKSKQKQIQDASSSSDEIEVEKQLKIDQKQYQKPITKFDQYCSLLKNIKSDQGLIDKLHSMDRQSLSKRSLIESSLQNLQRSQLLKSYTPNNQKIPYCTKRSIIQQKQSFTGKRKSVSAHINSEKIQQEQPQQKIEKIAKQYKISLNPRQAYTPKYNKNASSYNFDYLKPDSPRIYKQNQQTTQKYLDHPKKSPKNKNSQSQIQSQSAQKLKPISLDQYQWQIGGMFNQKETILVEQGSIFGYSSTVGTGYGMRGVSPSTGHGIRGNSMKEWGGTYLEDKRCSSGQAGLYFQYI